MPLYKLQDPQGNTREVEAPEGATMEQLVDFISQQDAAGGSGLVDQAIHKLKVFGSGAVRGVLGLPALGAEVAGAALRMETPNPVNIFAPESWVKAPNKAGEALKLVDGIGTKPVTSADKWVSSVGEGVGGGMTPGGPSTLLKSMAIGAASGLGAEAGGRLTDNNPLGRLLGSVVGGGVGGFTASLPGRVRGQSADLAREAVEGLTPEMLRKAQQFQASAKAQGYDMDLAQALVSVGAPESNLATLRNVLANSRHGTEVQKLLRSQQRQAELGAESFVGGLPGAVVTPQRGADWVQEAATDTIKAAKADRSELWKATFDASKKALKETEGAKFAAAQGLDMESRKALQTARGRLIELQRDLAGAKASDEAAVAALNAKAEEAAALVNRIREFALPRGSAAGNTGRLFDTAKRGESVMFDQIGRETAGDLASAAVPPKVHLAPSIQTLSLEAQMPGAQAAVDAAQAAADQTARGVGKAGASLRAVETVPAPVIERIAGRLQAEIDKVPNTGKGRMLQELRDSLFVDGKPIQDAEAINEVLKSQSARLKDTQNLSMSGVDAGAVKWLHNQIAGVRDGLGKASKPYQEANRAFDIFTQDVVDPLKKSVVGQVAGRRGAQADLAAPVARLNAIFSGADTRINGTAADIPKLFTELARVDKEAVPAAAKAFIAEKIQKGMQASPGELVSGSVSSGNVAQAVHSALFKTEPQMQAMRQITASMARNYGLDEKQLVKGMENFAQITKGMANVPQSTGGLKWQDVAKVGGSSALADTARVWSFMPAERVARRIEDATLGKTFQEFDRILTTPEGADLLLKLAKTPVMSNKALTLLATFKASGANSMPDQPE